MCFGYDGEGALRRSLEEKSASRRMTEVEEYIVENDTPDVTPLTTAAVGHLYLDHLEY